MPGVGLPWYTLDHSHQLVRRALVWVIHAQLPSLNCCSSAPFHFRLKCSSIEHRRHTFWWVGWKCRKMPFGLSPRILVLKRLKGFVWFHWRCWKILNSHRLPSAVQSVRHSKLLSLLWRKKVPAITNANQFSKTLFGQVVAFTLHW